MPCYLGRRCVDAECRTCGKRWQAANAQGVAAIHARAHKHYVCVEVVQYIFYGDPATAAEPDALKGSTYDPTNSWQ